jgi:hypothetical protein
MSNPGWKFSDPAAYLHLEIFAAFRCPSYVSSVVGPFKHRVSCVVPSETVLYLALAATENPSAIEATAEINPTSDTNVVFPHPQHGDTTLSTSFFMGPNISMSRSASYL